MPIPYTNEQYSEAHAAWRSNTPLREGALSEGTLRVFGWTRSRFVEEWLRGVYGE